MPITPLPTPPLRSDDPVTFASRADALLSALPGFVTEVNALGIDQAGTYAANALAYSANAAASANFAGEWADLSGALAVPASVSHDGRLWLLLDDLADVTASEPGVTADWQILPSLPSVDSRTSNTVFGRGDFGTILQVSGATWTQTLTAAATLGNGWWCIVKNTGTEHIVVDPDGAELIDGVATCPINPLEERLIVCTGTAFITTVLKPFYMEFTANGTFTKPLSGYSRIGGRLWGAGGSGSSAIDATGSPYDAGAGGGGGGACLQVDFDVDDAGTTAAVVIGAGGAAATRSTDGFTAGAAGGNSTVALTAKTITAYGGGAGTAGAFPNSGGGGGGGATSAGGASAAGGAGGGPDGGTNTTPGCGGFGGGGGSTSNVGGHAVYGGGGGAGGNRTDSSTAGASVYGGAGGGGGCAGDTNPGGTAGGASIFGGNGGAGAYAATGAVTATAGVVPGGGGGGAAGRSASATTSGAGGNGKCILWGIV